MNPNNPEVTALSDEQVPDLVVYFNRLLQRWMWYRESEPNAVSDHFATKAEAFADARAKLAAVPEVSRHDPETCGCGTDSDYCPYGGASLSPEESQVTHHPNCAFPIYPCECDGGKKDPTLHTVKPISPEAESAPSEPWDLPQEPQSEFPPRPRPSYDDGLEEDDPPVKFYRPMEVDRYCNEIEAALASKEAELKELRETLSFARREYGAFGTLSGETLMQMDRAVPAPPKGESE